MTALEKIKELRKINKYRKFAIYTINNECDEIAFMGESDRALHLARIRPWGRLIVTKVNMSNLDYWVLEVKNDSVN